MLFGRPATRELRDFSITARVIPISVLAIAVGVLGAFVALALLWLIAVFTNLFFFQRWSTALITPAGNHMGGLVVLVPVLGGLVVGLIARYGSERIRGHGIPEAIEAILVGGSRVEPRVALLKPLSSAIAIGSGGPFGAEGPIIMSGGAFGSVVAQFFRLTAAERKTLLAAGAAAGMSATFAAPVAAALLAFELLLFEWMPRSFVPVALASATAAIARHYLMGDGPMFPVPPHAMAAGAGTVAAIVLIGLLAGILSTLLTISVYAAEDAFRRLPLHWMWWPALGGIVVGVGGIFYPRALGVGYDVIAGLLRGDLPWNAMLGIFLVKWIIWAIALGSGTSGGVLAPMLMIGGALGGLASGFLPDQGAGFWELVSMGSVLAGTMRAPITAIVFSLELTHDINILPPLLIGSAIAHAFTTLVLPRSILTEKVSRRGLHISAEYSVDPLEILCVRDVMRAGAEPPPEPEEDLEVVAYPDETLRAVAARMAETGRTRLPVVDRIEPETQLGYVSFGDVLKARLRRLDEERRRERWLGRWRRRTTTSK